MTTNNIELIRAVMGVITEVWDRAKQIDDADEVLDLIEADRKRRGEPVATVRHFQYEGIARNGPSQEAVMIDGAPMLPDGTHLYAAPQTAELVKVRPETLSEHIARDMREGRFPDKSERKMVPAEPVACGVGERVMRRIRRSTAKQHTGCPCPQETTMKTQPLDELEMQDDVMKYDPATGEQRPYPSHAAQWRRWHGLGCAWLFDPWTGRRRNALDVGSDINGRLIVPAGTLGGDMDCGAPMQNTANAALRGDR